MTFYSKLTRELKKQFKTSDIPIPETRAKCVAVAQCIWDRLYRSDEKKSPENYKKEKDDQNKEKRKSTPEKEVICFKCNKPGHYATSCPDHKESKKAKIQSIQKDYL